MRLFVLLNLSDSWGENRKTNLLVKTKKRKLRYETEERDKGKQAPKDSSRIEDSDRGEGERRQWPHTHVKNLVQATHVVLRDLARGGDPVAQ